MAKAKAETSLWGEIFQSRLFKPTQGKIVRQITAVAVAAVFVLGAWRLHATFLTDSPPWTSISIPVVISLVGCWLAFRLVNWPMFANFLISVEAEMDKVSWATWDYLRRATGVVLATMAILGTFLFVCDVLWHELFSLIGFIDTKVGG